LHQTKRAQIGPTKIQRYKVCCNASDLLLQPNYFPQIEYYEKILSHCQTGHVTTVTKFCMMAPNICESWVWNLLHFTLFGVYNFELAHRSLGNLCAPILNYQYFNVDVIWYIYQLWHKIQE
jgi:hypothetical protein